MKLFVKTDKIFVSFSFMFIQVNYVYANYVIVNGGL